MLDFVDYGNSRIEFKIKWSFRKTLGISVLPCGSIEVTAPQGSEIEKIKDLVLKRGSWLLEQKRNTSFNPIPMPSKQFESGESFYYLGRQYRLKVFDSGYEEVSIINDRLVINCADSKNFELKRNLLLRWYSAKAEATLTERFRLLSEKFEHDDVKLEVKKLMKSWGEFHNSKNLIVLNSELIVAPVECIDYVIIHELSHSIILHHGSDFYAFMSSRLPGWRDLKSKLESYSHGFTLFE